MKVWIIRNTRAEQWWLEVYLSTDRTRLKVNGPQRLMCLNICPHQAGHQPLTKKMPTGLPTGNLMKAFSLSMFPFSDNTTLIVWSWQKASQNTVLERGSVNLVSKDVSASWFRKKQFLLRATPTHFFYTVLTLAPMI